MEITNQDSAEEADWSWLTSYPKVYFLPDSKNINLSTLGAFSDVKLNIYIDS